MPIFFDAYNVFSLVYHTSSTADSNYDKLMKGFNITKVFDAHLVKFKKTYIDEKKIDDEVFKALETLLNLAMNQQFKQEFE